MDQPRAFPLLMPSIIRHIRIRPMGLGPSWPPCWPPQASCAPAMLPLYTTNDEGACSRRVKERFDLLPRWVAAGAALIAGETEKWGKVVKFAGVKVE